MSLACCFFCLFRSARAVSRALKRLAKSPAGGSGTASKEWSRMPKTKNKYFRQPHLLRNYHHQLGPASSQHTIIKLLGRSVTRHPKKASWFIAGIACKERYAGRRKPRTEIFRQPHLLRNYHHQRPASAKHTIIKLLARNVTRHPKKASWFIAGTASSCSAIACTFPFLFTSCLLSVSL